MATEPATDTATAAATATKLKLDPPEVLQPVAPSEAAGLVPLKTEETTELDKRVRQFVDELANLDSNSPEFGKKVGDANSPKKRGRHRCGTELLAARCRRR